MASVGLVAASCTCQLTESFYSCLVTDPLTPGLHGPIIPGLLNTLTPSFLDTWSLSTQDSQNPRLLDSWTHGLMVFCTLGLILSYIFQYVSLYQTNCASLDQSPGRWLYSPIGPILVLHITDLSNSVTLFIKAFFFTYKLTG